MNLGGFIDTFKDANSAKGGGVLPAALPALGERRHAPPGCSESPWGHRPTPSGARLSPSRPTGAPPSSARWARARPSSARRRLTWRDSSASSSSARPTWSPSGSGEIEQTVPGVRAAIVESITDLERLRLSVGSGPLFAVMSREKAKLSYRWMPAVIERWGRLEGKALTGRGDGGALPGPLLPRLHGADRGQGRRAADVRGSEPPQAHLRRLRLPPLAGRQVRPGPLLLGRLHQAQDEGLLRPADRRRGP